LTNRLWPGGAGAPFHPCSEPNVFADTVHASERCFARDLCLSVAEPERCEMAEAHREPHLKCQETKMKTTLFLSTIAAGLVAASTMTFAQNFGAYATAVGQSNVSQSVRTAPIDRFTPADLGYQGKVTHGKAHTSRAQQ
jgi:hypothetical protein